MAARFYPSALPSSSSSLPSSTHIEIPLTQSSESLSRATSLPKSLPVAATTATAKADAQIREQQAESEPEQCPLCPPSGPSTPDQVIGDIAWIECNKCDAWYHSVCVSRYQPSTIPPQAVEAVQGQGESQDAKTFQGAGSKLSSDWPKIVDRWFCQQCIDFSISPDNPRPPRHPLTATLKKSLLRKRPAPTPKEDSTSNPPTPTRSNKRTRVDVKEQPIVAEKIEAKVLTTPTRARSTAKQRESINETETQTPVETAATATSAVTEARPKRQAALHAPDYANMHNHVPTPTRTWLELIKDPAATGRVIDPDNFPRVPGTILNREWLDSSELGSKFPPSLFWGEMREPLVVRPEDGGIESLGGKVPGDKFTVDDVARLVGPDRMVDVIDVATQQSSQWKLSKWASYLSESQALRTSTNVPSTSAPKVYNIISLEISGTDLAKRVKPPRIVTEIDWVDNCWHFKGGKQAVASAAAAQAANGWNGNDKIDVNGGVKDQVDGKEQSGGKAQNAWPKVQLYCLMGMKDSWTDWHVDFAASSVYYHIHTGSKVFFFIRPTERNLAAYKEWSGSAEMQQSVWLPDKCDGVRKITLNKGDTMIIPAGYIHAVYTPVDSIVFGGNFLHSYNIEAQLRLRQIEIDTKVPQRFRFPFFERLCWYVADRYCSDLRALRAYRPTTRPLSLRPPPTRVLISLTHLARFLIAQADLMEDINADEKSRRLAYDRVPTDVRVDPSGLARELMWRVERELPVELLRDLGGEEKVGLGTAVGAVKQEKPAGAGRKVAAKGTRKSGNGVNLEGGHGMTKSRKSTSASRGDSVGVITPTLVQDSTLPEPEPNLSTTESAVKLESTSGLGSDLLQDSVPALSSLPFSRRVSPSTSVSRLAPAPVSATGSEPMLSSSTVPLILQKPTMTLMEIETGERQLSAITTLAPELAPVSVSAPMSVKSSSPMMASGQAAVAPATLATKAADIGHDHESRNEVDIGGGGDVTMVMKQIGKDNGVIHVKGGDDLVKVVDQQSEKEKKKEITMNLGVEIDVDV